MCVAITTVDPRVRETKNEREREREREKEKKRERKRDIPATKALTVTSRVCRLADTGTLAVIGTVVRAAQGAAVLALVLRRAGANAVGAGPVGAAIVGTGLLC